MYVVSDTCGARMLAAQIVIDEDLIKATVCGKYTCTNIFIDLCEHQLRIEQGGRETIVVDLQELGVLT